MSTVSLAAQKLDQAVAILDALGIDAWLTFARETTESGDPVLPIILGHPVTWQSAFIVTRGGDRVAIVGKYEDEAVRSTGAWPEVVSYVQGIRDPLVETLGRLDPARLAVNYSVDDVKSDGLSHGMYLLLKKHLEGTPWGERLVSADEVIRSLRGRKTAEEVERIEAAIAVTDEIFEAVAQHVQPGTSELDVARFMHGQVDQHGLATSWERDQCPIVTTGPDSMVGHGLPSSTLQIEPGGIFHLDFGVCRHEYCSDIQRAWYVPKLGETAPPPAVQQGFDTVVRAIRAAFDTLAPGVAGWVVDDAARRVIVDAGYPEYQHATGHHVGRAAHDGAGVLGPRWERYGRTPEYIAEPGNVFTLELGVDNLDGRGYLGLEEMVLVTEDGCRWLTRPQETLPLLGA
ncbi:MAG: M24 family metallopeptidase [Planctomycetota bacterium]